jgi:isoquinoline 1-oxidoreductase beta subunit
MQVNTHIPRRKFLQYSVLSGTALALGYTLLEAGGIKVIRFDTPVAPGTAINPYIFIEPTGKITLLNHRPEMGQGTFESIPMIIAEELKVDPRKIEIAASPADRSTYGDQMVVGSGSIRSQFTPMLKVGAAAREMLIQAAANRI